MQDLWHRALKPTYRKEPIAAFLLTMGLVEAVIGGVGMHGSLLALGLATAGIAVVPRLLQKNRQNHRTPPAQGTPIHYLPERSSRPLPRLTTAKRPTP